MPWAPRVNAIKLKRECDRLSSELIRARADLNISERQRVGLEVALDVRGEKIDALVVQVERLRQQNRQLDEENDRLCEMVKFTVPAGAAAPGA
jgi:hypothetical protein